MTRYTVVWRKRALSGLARIWVEASDQKAITKAVALIDAQLAADAERKGDELHEGLRALIAAPLRVLYEVETEDRLARVLAVALL